MLVCLVLIGMNFRDNLLVYKDAVVPSAVLFEDPRDFLAVLLEKISHELLKVSLAG